MENIIGKEINHYHIIECIGEGGMATVYRALDQHLNREVAIKLIRLDKIQNEKSFKRFEIEARTLAKLSHPNIVRIFEYGQYMGAPYIVMDCISGGTLSDLIHKQRVDFVEAARLLLPISRALTYAHEKKIIHRDIKPSNILITMSGQPMLSDFGIAKLLEADETIDLTHTGFNVGTPRYMAPEQALSREADPRADIYSLGIVFYELVTGRTPYTANTPYEMLMQHHNAKLPDPRQFVPNLPQKLIKVLKKALEKNVTDRYQSMGEFASALESVLSIKVKKSNIPRQKFFINKKNYLIIVPLFIALVVFISLTIIPQLPRHNVSDQTNPIGSSQSIATNSNESINSTPIKLSTTAPEGTPTLPKESISSFFLTPPAEPVTLPTSEISANNLKLIIQLNQTVDNNSISDSKLSPDGKFLARSTNSGIVLRNILNGYEQLITDSAPDGEFSFSVDSSTFAYEGQFGYLQIMDLSSLKSVSELFTGDINCLHFSIDGKSLFTGGRDGIIRKYSLLDQQSIFLQGHSLVINSISISPDGTTLVSGGDDEVILLWSLMNDNNFEKLVGHTGAINDVIFSPDGTEIASASDDGTVRFWEVEKRILLHTLTISTPIKNITYLKDGSVMIVGLNNGDIRFYDVSDLKLLYSINAHSSEITGVSLSNNQNLLVSGATDGSINYFGIQ